MNVAMKLFILMAALFLLLNTYKISLLSVVSQAAAFHFSRDCRQTGSQVWFYFKLEPQI